MQDILESIESVQNYLGEMSFDLFCADKKTVDAVVRHFTIIGEAANHLPKDLTERVPSVPWARIKRMRNIVVHVYFGVDLTIVWETAKVNPPRFAAELRRMLADSGDESH